MRAVGIDLGTDRIKGVAVVARGKGVRVVDCLDLPVEGETDEARAASIVEGLATIRTRLRAASATVHVAVGLHEVHLREIDVPFADPRQVREVVPFEVEPLLPRPIEEMVIDARTLETVADRTRLVVAAIRRDRMEEILGMLAEAGLDPLSVGLDAEFLCRTLADDRKLPDWIVDVGSRKTVLLRRRGEGFDWIRSLPFGVARADADDPGELAADIERVAREIRRTTALAGDPPDRYLFTGGGIHREAILEGFAERLGAAVEILEDWPGLPDAGFLPALGGAVAGIRRSPVLDLRRGPFAYRRGLDRLAPAMVACGTALFLLLSILGVRFYLEWDLYTKRAEVLEAWKQRTEEAFFGDERHPDGTVAHFQEYARRGEAGGSVSGSELPSVLDLWQELHERLAPIVDEDRGTIVSYSFDPRKDGIDLEMEVDRPDLLHGELLETWGGGGRLRYETVRPGRQLEDGRYRATLRFTLREEAP